MTTMTKTDIDIKSLWLDYKKEPTLEMKHDIILHYIWLVKFVLKNMHLPTNSILEESDFLNIGILGLHEAIERYDPGRGIKFESYSIPRIRGTIQDELRRLDWLSRTARKKAHQYLNAGDALRSIKGREVTTEEIRKKLNVTPSEYFSYLSAAAAAKASLSLTESTQAQLKDTDSNFLEEIPDPSDKGFLDKIENEERIDIINSFLKKLTQRKRLVISLYYYENLTFKEIGKILNVSESRVCQIHSQVIGDVRTKLYETENA